MNKIDYENEPYWWPELSANPNAVDFLKNYIQFICWENFSKLENAIYIIQANYLCFLVLLLDCLCFFVG